MPTREVTFTITLDERDNETLEIVAGVKKVSPDDVLIEIFEPFQKHLKTMLEDLRDACKPATPVQRIALRAMGVAAETHKKKLTR